MKDKSNYIKVVYESQPIGKEHIILRLTTFDLEQYQKDQNRDAIKRFQVNFPVDAVIMDGTYGNNTLNTLNDNYQKYLENMLNEYVENFYKPYVDRAKQMIDELEREKEILSQQHIIDVTCNWYGEVGGNDSLRPPSA